MSSTNQEPSSAPFVQGSVTDRVTEQIPSAQSVRESADSSIETARQQIPGTQSSSEYPSSAPFAQGSVTDRITEQIPSAQSIQESASSTLESVRQQLPSMSSSQQSPSTGSTQGSVTERITQQIPSAQSIQESASSGLETARQQIPSTQQVSEQLPTVEGTTETIKQGANTLIEGIKSLAFGSSNAAPPKVTTEKPADPDDLHVPGSFEDEPITPQPQLTSPVLGDQTLSGTGQPPAHAGTGTGIPRDPVESSAAPDVSYEDHPKALSQADDLEREKERGLPDVLSRETAPGPADAGTGTGSSRDVVESSAAPDVSYEDRPTSLPHADDLEREKERGLQDFLSRETAPGPADAGAGASIPKNAVESTAAPDVSYEDRSQTLPQADDLEREKDRELQDVLSRETAPRPAHAGAGAGIPRNTVESTAAPDVSYEHRPKTLPQTEIIAREVERGSREGETAAPDRVAASRRGADWAPEATGSAEAVHEKNEVEKELLSKVEETPADIEAIAIGTGGPAGGVRTQVGESRVPGVVGAGPSSTFGAVSGSASQSTADSSSYDFNQGSHLAASASQPTSDVQSATTTMRQTPPTGVDLTAGVRNGVIGTGHDAKLQRHTSPAEVDLTAGVQNGVIGPGRDAHISSGPLALPKYEHDPADTAASSRSVVGGPIHIDVVKADLGAGVKNTVVGAGAGSGPVV